MNPIFIKKQDDTPHVKLDKENNLFEIVGSSLPENAEIFYSPVMHWVQEYVKDPNNKTVFELHFDHINTPSTKLMSQILLDLSTLQKTGKELEVVWYYNEIDEDMKELGEDFANITGIPFEFMPLSK